MKTLIHTTTHKARFLFLAFFFTFNLLSQTQSSIPKEIWISTQSHIESKNDFMSLKANGHLKELMHFSELLIKGSSFLIIDQNGKSEQVRLPDKIKLEKNDNSLTFQSQFKHKESEINFQGKILIEGDKLQISYKFLSPKFKMSHFIIQLNPECFFGDSFRIDGRTLNYPALESESKKLWQTLITETPFTNFTASLSKHKNLRITTGNDSKITVKYISTRWQNNFSLFLSCKDQKSINFKLQFPESTINPKPLSNNQANLLSNGSFEVGMKDWGVSFSSLNDRSTYSTQITKTPTGQRALVIDHKTVNPKYKQNYTQLKIQSEFIQIPARTPITYSFDVKSADKIINAKMVVRYQSVENIANAGTSIESKYIRISPQWKRHSFSLRLPRGMNNAYSFGLEYQGKNENGKQKVFFDGACVKIDHSADYSAQKELIIGAHIPQTNNLFELGQELHLKTYIKNNSKNNQIIKAKVKILDPHDKITHSQLQNFKLSSGQVTNDFLKDFYYRGQKLGPHKLVLEIYKNNELVDSYKKAFGFIQSNPKSSFKRASKFGLHMGGNNYQRSLKLASKIGFTWTRGGAFHNSWKAYQPSQNHWNKNFMDRNLAIIDDHEQLNMTPIVILGVKTPKWASSAPLLSKEYSLYPPADDKYTDFGNYVKKITQTYGKRIHAYEIWNEPNTSVFYRGSPGEFAKIIDSSSANITSENPDAKIIGFGLTHYDTSSSEFMLKSLKRTQSKKLNGISFHPYSDDRLSPEETNVQKQFEWIKKDLKTTNLNKNMELWATEFGWFAPHQNSQKFTPYKNAKVAKKLVSEHECARFYVQMVNTSLAHGLDKLFYFIFQEGTMSSRWFHGFVGPNAEFLKAPYYAAAIAIKNLDFKTSLKQHRANSGLVINTYKENMSVLWANKDLKVQIKSALALQCEDLYGNPFVVNQVNGIVDLSIGEDPIYIKKTLSLNQFIEP